MLHGIPNVVLRRTAFSDPTTSKLACASGETYSYAWEDGVLVKQPTAEDLPPPPPACKYSCVVEEDTALRIKYYPLPGNTAETRDMPLAKGQLIPYRVWMHLSTRQYSSTATRVMSGVLQCSFVCYPDMYNMQSFMDDDATQWDDGARLVPNEKPTSFCHLMLKNLNVGCTRIGSPTHYPGIDTHICEDVIFYKGNKTKTKAGLYPVDIVLNDPTIYTRGVKCLRHCSPNTMHHLFKPPAKGLSTLLVVQEETTLYFGDLETKSCFPAMHLLAGQIMPYGFTEFIRKVLQEDDTYTWRRGTLKVQPLILPDKNCRSSANDIGVARHNFVVTMYTGTWFAGNMGKNGEKNMDSLALIDDWEAVERMDYHLCVLKCPANCEAKKRSSGSQKRRGRGRGRKSGDKK